MKLQKIKIAFMVNSGDSEVESYDVKSSATLEYNNAITLEELYNLFGAMIDDLSKNTATYYSHIYCKLWYGDMEDEGAISMSDYLIITKNSKNPYRDTLHVICSDGIKALDD